MPETVLQKIVNIIKINPHSGLSLNLYALISTLRMEKSGYMYMLRKLRDLPAEHRAIAYELMELMAENGNQGEVWDAAVQAMDEAIKRG
ncbi:MAG: hypothetical protein BMS9Abin06_0716 [Gammaproteobacteria bacterium]|nr:MAG: hypothetical protein BMS9Abin06_0716 [Gammaproteobacteria bacterium]